MPPTPLDATTPHHFPTTRAYCTDFTLRASRSIRDTGGWAHLRPTNPTCKPVALPVAFEPNATFRHAHAFALDEGLSAETRLVVELADGLEETPIAWAFENRSSAQSVPHPTTLESLRIEGATLVAVVGQAQVSTTDAGAPEWVLLRGVIACAPGATLTCHSYLPPIESPRLGIKHRAYESTTPWSAITWDQAPSFALLPNGDLVLRD